MDGGQNPHALAGILHACWQVRQMDQRFCTDFKKVNAITKPECYPVLCIDNCIDQVGGAKFVSKLDLLKGYWQVPLTEMSSFITPWGLFSYFVMPFGLRNAPATSQHLMNKVLADLASLFGDVVVFSVSVQCLTVWHRLV